MFIIKCYLNVVFPVCNVAALQSSFARKCYHASLEFVCVSFVVARFLLCVLRLDTFRLVSEPLFR